MHTRIGDAPKKKKLPVIGGASADCAAAIDAELLEAPIILADVGLRDSLTFRIWMPAFDLLSATDHYLASCRSNVPDRTLSRRPRISRCELQRAAQFVAPGIDGDGYAFARMRRARGPDCFTAPVPGSQMGARGFLGWHRFRWQLREDAPPQPRLAGTRVVKGSGIKGYDGISPNRIHSFQPKLRKGANCQPHPGK